MILYEMTVVNHDKKALKDLASGLLGEGKGVRVKAGGTSMYPEIKAGSILHIGALKDPDDIAVGDIIAWEREDDMVVHRVIHKYRHDEKTLFITRGDSALTSDSPVAFDDIAGKVVLIETTRGKTKPVRKAFIRERRYRLNRRRVWVRTKWNALFKKIGLVR